MTMTVSHLLLLLLLCIDHAAAASSWTQTLLSMFHFGSSSPPPSKAIKGAERIIEGDPAPMDRYPYMVSLTQRNALQCGGALIAPDIIFTAQHCIDYVGAAEVGRYNISDANETYETHVFEHVERHPRWYAQSPLDVDEHDYALIKIFHLSTIGKALAINRDANIPNMKDESLLVLGWGKPTVNGTEITSDVLMTANVFYIPNDECRGIAANTPPVNLSDNVFDITLCAADFDGGSDTCTGDSGGPIVLEGSNADSDVHLGITSYGYGCGHGTLPGLYARTSYVVDWITEHVCNLSLDPPSSYNCPMRNVAPDPSDDLVDINVTLQLDAQFPQETGWIIQSENEDGVMATHYYVPIGSYANVTVPQNAQVVQVSRIVQLPDHRDYVFTIFDSFGDGNVQATLYRVDNETTPILQSPVLTGGYSVSYELTVGSPPSSSPTMTPAPTTTMPPSSSPTEAPPFITILIKFDVFPQETGWHVEALFTNGTRETVEQVFPGTYQEKQESVEEVVPLLSETPMTYQFTITDNERDGICCAYSVDGEYEVWLGEEDSGTLVASGAEFLWEEHHIFTVGMDGNVTSPPPTTAPMPTAPMPTTTGTPNTTTPNGGGPPSSQPPSVTPQPTSSGSRLLVVGWIALLVGSLGFIMS